MTNFLLFLIICFVFVIFVMQFASLLGQAKKNAEEKKQVQIVQESFRNSIHIVEEREEYCTRATYSYVMRDDSPIVTYLVYNDGPERISLSTNKGKSARLNVYGIDQIKLLGAAIQHQKGSLFDRGV
ncbi:hypothetical protein KKB41_01080 [Patescibacteria group bacterium]|nr:hypothetical protein [Patescibacteria group bacterium]